MRLFHLRSSLIGAISAVVGCVCASAFAQEAPVEVVRGGRVVGPSLFSLAVDANGYIYVGAGQSSNVMRFASSGDLPARFPGQTGAQDPDPPCASEIVSKERAARQGVSWDGPKGIAISSAGDVYVAGNSNSTREFPDNLIRVGTDGTITEVANILTLAGVDDWNPAGLGLHEAGEGIYLYATGPAGLLNGVTVRVSPDGVAEVLDPQSGGQGLVVDDATGDVYYAKPNEGVIRIPDARTGICGTSKTCDTFLTTTPIDCDGNVIQMVGPYAVALAGNVLYVSTHTGGLQNVVVRRPLGPNTLSLPACAQQIFPVSGSTASLVTIRQIQADEDGNVYAAGSSSDNVVWIRPDAANPGKVIATEVIGSRDGLDQPQGLAMDTKGNVYVGGRNSNNVFRVRMAEAAAACGNGALDPGEACDYAQNCCCDLDCKGQGAGTTCRDLAGDCDVRDSCGPAVARCLQAVRPAGEVCRLATGACDRDERCSGIGPDCADDQFLGADVVCRDVTVDCAEDPEHCCDVAESCTGTGRDCPVDFVLPLGTICRESANDCDEPERCQGVGTCPVDDTGARAGQECTPLGDVDLSCVLSAACDQDKTCQPDIIGDGEACGGFCGNTVCDGGRCLERVTPHPCGPDPDDCDATNVGRECKLCGDGEREDFEGCDDGNQVDTDGCSNRCRPACNPQVAGACDPQPRLTSEVADPCRRLECQGVDDRRDVEFEGFECKFVNLGCQGCMDGGECPNTDVCAVPSCETNRCVQTAKTGRALSECRFLAPFPGNEQGDPVATPGDDCTLAPSRESVCGPQGSRPAALCAIRKVELKAKALVQQAYDAADEKLKGKRLRKACTALRRAQLLANKARRGKGRISDNCQSALVARFGAMLQNVRAVEPEEFCPGAD
jgi:cysteine-rich repeat protein